jgi:hypothetical protein
MQPGDHTPNYTSLTDVTFDTGEAYARDTIHLEGQQQTMPMDRRIFVEVVCDPQANILTLAEANERARHSAVEADRSADFTIDAHRLTSNAQAYVSP